MGFLDYLKQTKNKELIENLLFCETTNIDNDIDLLLKEAVEVPIDSTVDNSVIFVKIDKMYDKTISKYKSIRRQIESKINNFIEHKKNNPTTPFLNDTPFKLNTKIWHYDVARDLSLVYHMTREDNKIKFIFFGVYSHDDIGSSGTNIGNNPTFKKISNMI